MDRRRFGSLMGGSISYLLFARLFSQRAFAGTRVETATSRWLSELHEMALDLRTDQITPQVWQDRVAVLFDQVPLEDLLTAIDFERLASEFAMPDKGVNTKRVRFPALETPAGRPVFISKIFGMKKDRAIIPHGHRNMVSCHVVLDGELHLRQFDRLDDDGANMILEPTVDEIARPASCSSISDERNNVHWLVAKTSRAFTFDVIVLDLGGETTRIENLDPEEAEELPGGRLRVPKLEVGEALEKYGHATHHGR